MFNTYENSTESKKILNTLRKASQEFNTPPKKSKFAKNQSLS